MKTRGVFLRVCICTAAIVAGTFAYCGGAQAQKLEVNGDFEHVSGDFGLNGFSVGTGWFFSPQVELSANYDDTWNDSTIGTFEFSSIGPIGIRSHIQNFLTGPRYYFERQEVGNKKKYVLRPFAELQLGVTHISQSVDQLATTVSASDQSFSWMLGGGVDYTLASHWDARFNLGLLRTHLDDSAQSRLRLGLGISYTF